MSKLSHSNPNLGDCLNAANAHKALGKTYPEGHCPRCGEEECSPNVEAFEMTGEVMCTELPTSEDIANAKLIAAAPDMAEALKKMLAWHNGGNEKKYQPMQSILEEACAALAKAGIE